ncbi:MAG: hypothetical protein K2P79_07885 [Sphingomonas sp.]|nr:hypothetical protein [Sphingomonas sp.]
MPSCAISFASASGAARSNSWATPPGDRLTTVPRVPHAGRPGPPSPTRTGATPGDSGAASPSMALVSLVGADCWAQLASVTIAAITKCFMAAQIGASTDLGERITAEPRAA